MKLIIEIDKNSYGIYEYKIFWESGVIEAVFYNHYFLSIYLKARIEDISGEK